MLAALVAENRRLKRRLLQIQQDERGRLARDLHDEIGQCVSAIHADAVVIRNVGGAEVRDSAEAIVAVAGQIKNRVRNMLRRLRQPPLEGPGLSAALGELTAAFRKHNPQVVCVLRGHLDLAGLDGEAGIAIFRVIQECLNNVATHARAHCVTIDIAQTAAADSDNTGRTGTARFLTVTVTDDGVGFSAAAANPGFGLVGIRERITVLGGTCAIESNLGSGTRVAVKVPVRHLAPVSQVAESTV